MATIYVCTFYVQWEFVKSYGDLVGPCFKVWEAGGIVFQGVGSWWDRVSRCGNLAGPCYKVWEAVGTLL